MNKKNQRAAKILQQQNLVNAARSANRSLSAEEQAQFDSLQREIDTLTAEIAAEGGTPAPATPTTGNRSEGGTPAPTPDHGTPADPEQQRQAAVTAERTRISEITSLCRDFGMDPQSHIDNGSTIDQVRAAIMDDLRQNHSPVFSSVRMGESGEDEYRRDAVDGLLIRGGLSPENASADAHRFANMSLRDLAIESLERAGVTSCRRMSSDEIYTELMRQYYNPTAAFPAILDNAVNKAYVEGHRTAAVTFDLWTKKGSLKDFKIHDNNYLAGPIGDFLEVPEGGELKNDKPTDAKLPTRQLKTYGKQFTLSRQAFINDDIELVTSMPARYAAAARRTINTQCYQILMTSPAIYDGKPLFHKDHRNLITTGTGITKDSFQRMILALSTQTDQFGQPIIVRPNAIITPVGLDFDIYTILNSPTINTAENTQAANPLFQDAFKNIQVVADPTINTLAGGFGKPMPWFMTANPMDSAFIEVDYLNGQEIPTIRRMETPGQLGFVWDIYLDWGISVMDYRGAIKNPGVAVQDPLGK